MLEVVGEKLEGFIKNEVTEIYFSILEKYKESLMNIDIKGKGVMKSKEELTTEAANEIKSKLQKPAEENFLKAVASNLFQNIIKIFQEEMINKLFEFIKDTEEINKCFSEFNDLIPHEDQSLKIEGQFQDYIKNLKKKEIESQEKALKYLENSDENQGGGSSSLVHSSSHSSSTDSL